MLLQWVRFSTEGNFLEVERYTVVVALAGATAGTVFFSRGEYSELGLGCCRLLGESELGCCVGTTGEPLRVTTERVGDWRTHRRVLVLLFPVMVVVMSPLVFLVTTGLLSLGGEVRLDTCNVKMEPGACEVRAGDEVTGFKGEERTGTGTGVTFREGEALLITVDGASITLVAGEPVNLLPEEDEDRFRGDARGKVPLLEQ